MDTNAVKQKFEELKKIDYSLVDHKYLENNRTKKPVQSIRFEALKFLAMASVNNKPYSPSKMVDNYWHECILNTRVYSKISKTLGKVIEHVPSDGSRKEFVKARNNIELFRDHYEKIFGEVPRTMWKNVASSHNCSCSGCTVGS